MNARENRMRIAREARQESETSRGMKRRDEADPNRLILNSNDIRFAESMRKGKSHPALMRTINGKPIRYK